MDHSALRNAAPVDRLVGEYISLDDGHRSIEIGEHPRGQ
jgi:hypothetical protein